MKSYNPILPLLFIAFCPYTSHAQQKIDSHDPVWSPDGSKIAFYSNKDGDFEVYVVDKDGTNLIQITKNEVQDGGPVWSPDGKQLLFNSSRNGRKEFYLYNFETGETKQLTETSGSESAAAWSPDGKCIAFESNIDGPRDIYLMNSDGSDIRNLTKNDANDFRPGWSLDSKTIFFNSKRTGKYQLFKMDLEGNVEQVLESDDNQVSPTVMHKQNKLIFTNHGENSVDIQLLDLTTKKVETIPHGPGELMLPSFSPDDSEIVFVLIEGGVSRICVMDYAAKKRRFLVDF